MGEVYCHDIWRVFKAADEVSTLSKNDHIVAWEVDPQDVAAYECYSKSYPSTAGDPDRLRMIVIMKRPAKKAYSEWETFGLPVLLSVDTAAVPTVKALYKVAEERFGHDCEDFKVTVPCHGAMAAHASPLQLGGTHRDSAHGSWPATCSWLGEAKTDTTRTRCWTLLTRASCRASTWLDKS